MFKKGIEEGNESTPRIILHLVGRYIQVREKLFHDTTVEVPMTSLSAGFVTVRVTFGKTAQITIIIRKDILIILTGEA
jgi:hypothetical protein